MFPYLPRVEIETCKWKLMFHHVNKMFLYKKNFGLVWTTISHPSYVKSYADLICCNLLGSAFRKHKCESMVFHGGTSAWTASYLGGLDKDWTPPWVFPYVNQEFTNCSSAGNIYLENNRVPPHIIFLVWTTLVEAPLIWHQFTDCSSKERIFLDEHTRFTYMNSIGTVQEQITFFQWYTG